MNNVHSKKEWEQYCAQELEILEPILRTHGYTLDAEQKHIQGERYLMQAITTTSGKKLILTGKTQNNTKVIIKATRDSAGTNEIDHERTCRDFLKEIDFAGEVFHTPQEIAYFRENGFTIAVQQFIDQTSSFIERPTPEQFAFALRAFKGQESAHATTAKHQKSVTCIYGMRDIDSYTQTFASFCENIEQATENTGDISTVLKEAKTTLEHNAKIIEQYCNFLTHTDFVPHNIRINNDTIYLLDHSSLTFGNKYEGWARFINFMTLYNPPLQRALEQYIRDNRTPEEAVSLRMMRIYRLGEILWYYVRATGLSTDSLHALNVARIKFWSEVLVHVLKDTDVPQSVIETYIQTRDSLRSEDEKQRQQGLH